MKIETVEALHLGQFLYARITTKCGRIGIGESCTWGHVEACEAALNKFGEYLQGKDARQIEHHWNVMHRFAYFQGAAINGAISAIDIALWDLKGKLHGAPVYELLGGAVRHRIRVYGHAYDRTADAVAAKCRRLKENGFTAIGHLNPFLDEEYDTPLPRTRIANLGNARANVDLFRSAVGDDCDLLIELHRRLSPADAVTFCRSIEEFSPMWVEDPVRPENPDAMAWVADRINLPVATGERFTSLYDFQVLMARQGVRFARVSLGLCGGITGAKKIAALAEANGIDIAPHCPLSPISLAACAHLDMSVPNFAIQEFATGLNNHKLVSGDVLLGEDIADWAPRVEQGYLTPPSGDGLGVALVTDAQTRRPIATKHVGMRMGHDGAPVDQ